MHVFLNFPPKHPQTQGILCYSLCLKCLSLLHCLVPNSFQLLVCSVSSSFTFGRSLMFSFLGNIIPHLLLSSPHHISLTLIQIWPSHFYVTIKICSQLHYNDSLYLLTVCLFKHSTVGLWASGWQ